MTDRAEALRALLEKIDAGKWNVDIDEPVGTVLHDWYGQFDDAVNGSLDAAKELHESVLPKMSYEIRESGFGGAFAYLWNPRKQPRLNDGYRTEADTPARAWLCAILKALIAQEETDR